MPSLPDADDAATTAPSGGGGLSRAGLIVVPVAALVVLVLEWGRDLPTWLAVLTGLVLAATVLVGVHHAEVVAHRVGEPKGSLVLAIAVTVIEVGLIVSVMSSGKPGSDTLARDTVFAAVMITLNGIVGICLVVASLRTRVVRFTPEGAGAALAAVTTLAVLSLVLPTLTTSAAGPVFTGAQLAFAAVTSLVVWLLFVGMQTRRHREWFDERADIAAASEAIAEGDEGAATIALDAVADDNADETTPTAREAWRAFVLLCLSLVAVIGLAKVLSPTLERQVVDAGLPLTVVGVVIALLVLLPETLTAVRAARRGRVQQSFNLAYGSAMASIGLTIPVLAVASALGLVGQLALGLRPSDIALLAVTVAVSILTVAPGKATLLQGSLHLSILGGYLVLAAYP